MPLTPLQFQHKINATIALGVANCAAAAAEPSAAFATFQRMQPNNPPDKNASSAESSLKSACHFSGKNAICAEFAA